MTYNLKKIFKFIVQLVVVLAVIGGVAYYIQTREGTNNISRQQEKTFPQLAGPTQKSYYWKYGGKEYELSQTLYQSSYHFYQDSLKTFSYFGALPTDWQEQYYGMFLATRKEDDVIANLAKNIKKLGEDNGLSGDQIAELTIAFVQAIPYDDAKADIIDREGKDETVRYPYEVLYEKSGVCSEKSLLTVALLRSLGFGAVLFAYEQDNHMAVGVQCPKEYSTYGSGYCYAETTTSGHKIGIIPEIDSASKRTVAVRELGSFEQEGTALAGAVKELGSADMYQKTVAGEYRGIIATIRINQEIAQLQKDIAALRKNLVALQPEVNQKDSQLQKMESEMNKYKRNGDVDKYNALVEPYNKKVSAYKKAADEYNSLVDQYNKKVARYNALIKQ